MRILSKVFAAGLMLALAACVSSRPAPPAVVAETATVHQDTLSPGASRLAAAEGGRRIDIVQGVPEPAPTQRLGTQWGETIPSTVRLVQLDRLWSSPDAHVTIRYDGGFSAGTVNARIRRLPVAYGWVEWTVLDARGRAMPVTRMANGEFRLRGRSGDAYQLALSNRGRQTVEVVATVDGLDVLRGRPGSVASRGYVVRPGDMVVIEGFRQSEFAVAAFRFAAPGDAYAANTPQGDPRNIGVIGLALFTLDDPANEVVAGSPRPFPADEPRDPRFAPPPVP
ncbi:hypothetical protein [Inquilinus limosus]|uniref:Uncharacterized protein n=1 Tax=Inquilinus limosus TaxID=171674 RepID=A0A211ZNB8_9PROT|nr:hypothetical protein [Inquilinus limosus]OWJ66739.1 hypothetical protein BWR60_13210 [Inquilinus limosus]